jgi:hypothetical protein
MFCYEFVAANLQLDGYRQPRFKVVLQHGAQVIKTSVNVSFSDRLFRLAQNVGNAFWRVRWNERFSPGREAAQMQARSRPANQERVKGFAAHLASIDWGVHLLDFAARLARVGTVKDKSCGRCERDESCGCFTPARATQLNGREIKHNVHLLDRCAKRLSARPGVATNLRHASLVSHMAGHELPWTLLELGRQKL